MVGTKRERAYFLSLPVSYSLLLCDRESPRNPPPLGVAALASQYLLLSVSHSTLYPCQSLLFVSFISFHPRQNWQSLSAPAVSERMPRSAHKIVHTRSSAHSKDEHRTGTRLAAQHPHTVPPMRQGKIQWISFSPLVVKGSLLSSFPLLATC